MTTPQVFVALLDNAAIFPPEYAPMRAALFAHSHHRKRWYGDLLGPFVCSAERLDELCDALPRNTPPGWLSISVTTPADRAAAVVDQVAADPRIALAALELARVETAESARRAADAAGTVPAFVEVAWTAGPDVLDAIAGTAAGVKLRSGGVEAAAFPTEAQLAAALAGCVRRGIPLKCTAGLHHAIRHTDAVTGFEHHGFLNVMAGVAAAQDGADVADLVHLLASRSADDVAAAAAGWDGDRAVAVRAAFRSVGTCSVADPVTDLVALGLLAAPAPAGGARG